MHAKSLQSCLILCNPVDCSPPGSSVHGFSRQEYWSGFPDPPPGDLPDPGIEPTSFMSPALAGGFFTTSATWEAQVKTHNFIIVTMYQVGQKLHSSKSLRTNLNELFGQPNRHKNFTIEYFFLDFLFPLQSETP